LAVKRTSVDRVGRDDRRVKRPTVYMLASRRNGTLYVGVSSELTARVHEHKSHAIDGFTKDHGVDRLVWFEAHPSMESAIQREKRIKKWNRAWKLELIERMNPDWDDLFETMT
jgi:putative endonuclease